MASTATVRRLWQRLTVPTLLAAIWVVVYSLTTLRTAPYEIPADSTLRFLFSTEHLTQPGGVLYVATLAIFVVGVGLRAFMLWRGY